MIIYGCVVQTPRGVNKKKKYQNYINILHYYIILRRIITKMVGITTGLGLPRIRIGKNFSISRCRHYRRAMNNCDTICYNL